jgi:nitrate/TMAO reductase-like tetraheme cytochrome c subunit
MKRLCTAKREIYISAESTFCSGCQEGRTLPVIAMQTTPKISISSGVKASATSFCLIWNLFDV